MTTLDCGEDKKKFRFWGILTIFLVLLGINKQLDIQSLFTEIGRIIAKDEGWYSKRRMVQFVFVMIITFAGVMTVLSIWWALRDKWKDYVFPLSGVILLATFIIVRAASFHHVDRLLKSGPAGIRLNWILELGGICLIGMAAVMEKVSPSKHPLSLVRKDR